MSKHTPGPWHSKNCSAILAPDGKSVASTNRRRRPDYIGNAYLIATAPRMYGALKHILSSAKWAAENARSDSPARTRQMRLAWAREARVIEFVLAEAEGHRVTT